MPSRGQEPRRRLATVLFTDIVGSTEKAAEFGDRQWRKLLSAHHALIRKALRRHHGREIDTAGDGFFATFDQPSDAIACAQDIHAELAAINLPLRAGVHMGEVEVMGSKVAGMSVHIGARLMSLAGAGETVVSSTVRDLMTGSDLPFVDRGFQRLKGVDSEWHVYVVETKPIERPAVGAPQIAEDQPLWGRRAVLAAAAVVAVVGVGAFVLASRGGKGETTVPAANTLVNIEGSSVGAVLPVGTGPKSIAVDGTTVWVANTTDRTVQPVDVDAEIAQPAQGGLANAPTSIAVGGGAVWIGSSLVTDGSLVRIDPTQRNSARPIAIGVPVNGLAFGGGAVWISDHDDGLIVRVDAATGAISRFSLDPGSGPTGLVYADDAIWVAMHDAKAIARVDPANGDVMQTIPIAAGSPDQLAAGDGFVWVTVGDGDAVVRIDAASNSTFTVSDVGDGPAGVAVAADGVWVADALGSSIVRIDADTGHVSERVALSRDLSPQGVASTPKGVWVSIVSR